MFLSYENVGSRESEVGRIQFIGYQLRISPLANPALSADEVPLASSKS